MMRAFTAATARALALLCPFGVGSAAADDLNGDVTGVRGLPALCRRLRLGARDQQISKSSGRDTGPHRIER
jgi:hypothetical protein